MGIFQNVKLLGQSLEPKLLLAADLAIDFEASGQQVDWTLRVTNHGDMPAIDAVVQSSLDDLLVDPVWTRQSYPAPKIEPPAEPADLVVVDTFWRRSRMAGLGDVNGDGTADFGITVGARKFVVYGQEGGIKVTTDGSSDGEALVSSGELGATEIVVQANWYVGCCEPLGDFDNDGYDDFKIGGKVINGRSDFPDLDSIRVNADISARSKFSLGDVNGDGRTDSYWRDSDQRRQYVLIATEDPAAPRRVEMIADDPRFNVSMDGLGDINGDGFDDLRFGRYIIAGNAGFGAAASITPDELLPEEVVAVTGTYFEGVGDVNADGVDDLAIVDGADTKIIWGYDQIVGQQTLTRNETGIEVPAALADLKSIGDLNDDGYDDFVSKYSASVLLGGPDTAVTPEHRFTSLRIPETPSQLDETYVRSENADMNGDGIQDLVVHVGHDCFSCTSTDRGFIDVVGGTLIAFGNPNFAQSSVIEPDATVTIGYAMQGWPPSRGPTIFDRNADGIPDLQYSAGGKQFLVYGGPDIRSHDFGYLGANPINSEVGHVIEDELYWFDQDINLDGSTDRAFREYGHEEITSYYFDFEPIPFESPASVSSRGNISEVLSLSPGEQVVYKISGQLESEDIDQLMATVSIDNTSEDYRDNVYPRGTAASQLETDVEVQGFMPNVEGDQAVTGVVTVSNLGPSDLTNITIDESLTEGWQDVSWDVGVSSLTTSKIPHRFGPQVQGTDLSPGPWRTLEQLGSKVGNIGDLNGDGFQDLFASTVDGVRVFWGSDDQQLSHSTRITGIRVSDQSVLRTVGDVNADGFSDFFVTGFVDRNQLVRHIILGSSDIPTLDRIQFTNLDTIQVVKSLDKLETAGDINGDGLGDWISENTILLGSENGLFQDGSVVATTITSADPLFPVGDLNHDGFSDFAYADRNRSELTIGFGRSEFVGNMIDIEDESHHTISNVDVDEECHTCTVGGDFNGDAIDDLAFATPFGMFALFGTQDLAEQSTNFDSLDPSKGFIIKWKFFADEFQTTHGDYDGDGVDEIAFATSDATGTVTVLFSNDLRGEVNLSSMAEENRLQLTYPSGLPLTLAHIGDVTGDQIDDLLVGDSPPRHWALEEWAGQVHLLTGSTNFGSVKLSGIGRDTIPHLSIPAGGTATLTVTGVLPDGNALVGEVSALPNPSVFLLAADANRAVVGSLADLNLSGTVDFRDFLILSSNFGREQATREMGDLDDDSVVGFSDFLILSAAFGRE